MEHTGSSACSLSGLSRENFVTSLEREAEEARFEYVFSFDDTISITTYLDPFNENTLLLAAQRPGLSQLSEHEGRVVWVQLKAESTTEYKIASFDLFARQYSPLPSLEPPPGVSFTAPQVRSTHPFRGY